MSFHRLGLVFALCILTPSGLVAQDPAAAARRLASLAQLAAEEYRLGVKQGRIVAAAEVEEARLFLEAEASGRGAIMIAGRMADRATDRVNRTTLKIASALGRLAPEVAAELGIK